MLFRVTSQLDYTVVDPSTFVFALKCVETSGQRILNESFTTTPGTKIDDFSLPGGWNRFSRIRTHQPGTLGISYQARVATTLRFLDVAAFYEEDAGTMLHEVVPFLFPSRYCQSDALREHAFNLFGQIESPYAVALAINNWIHTHIRYVIGSSTETTSALDTLEQKQGVCRDFAQLGIAFCRAMSIPARYATCYAHRLQPQDFHACFEVSINGWWIVFDPTGLAPLNGLVRIATGRDAADTAVCTIFGNTELLNSHVTSECEDPGWTALTQNDLASTHQALALD